MTALPVHPLRKVIELLSEERHELGGHSEQLKELVRHKVVHRPKDVGGVDKRVLGP